MGTRRSKTESKYGTYRDIPKKFISKQTKPRKKYIYIHEEKHYNIIAYSCTDIANHFKIKREVVQRGVRVVEKFDGDIDLNLCLQH
jgi:hypothetical protein